MSDSDDSLNDLLCDSYHKESSVSETTKKEISSPIESWLASSQSQEDKFVKEYSEKLIEQPQKKKEKKSLKRKPKVKKVLLSDDDDDDFETPGLLKPNEPIDGPNIEDVNEWNVAGHSDIDDFVWVKIRFKPAKLIQKTKDSTEDDDQKKDEQKEEESIKNGKKKAKKEKKKTKKELKHEAALAAKAETRKRNFEEAVAEMQWWPGRKITHATERRWLNHEKWIQDDLNYDKYHLVSLFDDKNSLVSVTKSNLRDFDHGDKKKSKKKSLMTKKSIMTRVWSRVLSEALLENYKSSYTTKATIKAMLSKSYKWLKTTLKNEVTRATGEVIEDDDDDDDDDDDGVDRQALIKAWNEANQQPLMPETLRAGDMIRFHDERFRFGRSSRREATILAIKPGGLASNQFPLLLSNGLDVLIGAETSLRRLEEVKDDDEVGEVDGKNLTKRQKTDDKEANESKDDLIKEDDSVEKVKLSKVRKLENEPINDPINENKEEEGEVKQKTRWRPLNTFTLIEGAGDETLKSDQTAIAETMKQHNIEVQLEMTKQHEKFFKGGGKDLSDDRHDDDDDSDDDDPDTMIDE